jgi:hypothetical protein
VEEKVFFTIDGPEEGRRVVAEFLADELGARPREVKAESSGQTRINPVTLLAIGSLVLAVPASVVAVYQLADRMRVKSRLERLLQRIETLDIEMTLKDGRSVSITKDAVSLSIRTSRGDVVPLKKELMPEILKALQGLG